MISAFEGAILDIDGVLEFQGVPYPGAIETFEYLRRRGVTLRILTNSTLRSRATTAARLRGLGFQVDDDEVITASYATSVYLRQAGARSCWVMLDGSGLDEFRDLPQSRDGAEYVVVGDYRRYFTFDSLNHALRLLHDGAKLVGMIGEIIDYSQGSLELNVGSWVRLLERASGVPALIIGKPSPFGFELALESMNLDRKQVVVVGDQLGTDIRGAQGVGLASILVRSGEYAITPEDADVKADLEVSAFSDVKTLF